MDAFSTIGALVGLVAGGLVAVIFRSGRHVLSILGILLMLVGALTAMTAGADPPGQRQMHLASGLVTLGLIWVLACIIGNQLDPVEHPGPFRKPPAANPTSTTVGHDSS